jgi:hypothetical protein
VTQNADFEFDVVGLLLRRCIFAKGKEWPTTIILRYLLYYLIIQYNRNQSNHDEDYYKYQYSSFHPCHATTCARLLGPDFGKRFYADKSSSSYRCYYSTAMTAMTGTPADDLQQQQKKTKADNLFDTVQQQQQQQQQTGLRRKRDITAMTTFSLS